MNNPITYKHIVITVVVAFFCIGFYQIGKSIYNQIFEKGYDAGVLSKSYENEHVGEWLFSPVYGDNSRTTYWTNAPATTTAREALEVYLKQPELEGATTTVQGSIRCEGKLYNDFHCTNYK